MIMQFSLRLELETLLAVFLCNWCLVLGNDLIEREQSLVSVPGVRGMTFAEFCGASDVIAVGVVDNASTNVLRISVVEVLKGRLQDKKVTVHSSENAPIAITAAVKTMLPVLIFKGNYPKRFGLDGRCFAYVYCGSTDGPFWYCMSEKDGQLLYRGIEGALYELWYGDSSRLIEFVRYIIRAGSDAVDTGGAQRVTWEVISKLTSTNYANATDALAVDINGKECIYLACSSGDRVFRFDNDKRQMEDVTPILGLTACSSISTWADFNGDGRSDLLSYDKGELSLHLASSTGIFTRVALSGYARLPREITSLQIVALPDCKRPVILVSCESPFLLIYDGGKVVTRREISQPSEAAMSDSRKCRYCVVADFTNDGYLDILQVFDKGAWLRKGDGRGFFSAGESCGEIAFWKRSIIKVLDVDNDGWLDILAKGSDEEQDGYLHHLRVYQNDRHGTFANVVEGSGLASSSNDRFLAVADFNNDGREDLLFGIGVNDIWAGVGFGYFMRCSDVGVVQQGKRIEVLKNMLKVISLDLNTDGVQDVVLVSEDGCVIAALGVLEQKRSLSLSIGVAREMWPVGVLNVTCKDSKQYGIGVRQTSHCSAAFFGCPRSGDYTLQWQFPGQPVQSAVVQVKDDPVRVLLGRHTAAVVPYGAKSRP